MKATLEMINGMQTEGVIGKYAIAGAVGATFYLEPSATADIDIFVMRPAVVEWKGSASSLGTGQCSSWRLVMRWNKRH